MTNRPKVGDDAEPGIESLIIYVYCCRAWPVLGLYPMGRCGLCGERPTVVKQ